jgi:hypothetical protein
MTFLCNLPVPSRLHIFVFFVEEIYTPIIDDYMILMMMMMMVVVVVVVVVMVVVVVVVILLIMLIITMRGIRNDVRVGA